jgi:hypothetical protein
MNTSFEQCETMYSPYRVFEVLNRSKITGTHQGTMVLNVLMCTLVCF